MHNIKELLLLAILLVVSGCGRMISELYGVPVLDPDNITEIRFHTKINYDLHEDSVKVVGPVIYSDNNIFSPTYRLRAWGSKNQNGEVKLKSCQLYVHASFGDWAFLDRAFSHGERYEVVEIDSEVGYCSSYGDCTIYEDVGVTIPIDECKMRGEELGFSVKIVGSGGSLVLDVPPGYFKGVVDAAN